MSTLGVAVGALGAGIPDGTVAPMVAIGLTRADIVAGLGALLVATLGVLVVRRLQNAQDVPPNPAASPDPMRHELKRAA